MIQISLITIGTELLKGRIVNTNATEAANILKKYGFSISRVLTIADTRNAILSAVEAEIEGSDAVILSGGLGPTKDDITKFTLAEWFGTELVWHAPTLSYLEQRYKNRPKALTELTRRQAMVPEGSQVLPNPKGTAPGMAFARQNKWVFSLPGVPYEMLYLLENEVVPVLQNHFQTAMLHSRIIRVANIPESAAAMRMETIEASLPNSLEISYLPRLDGLWLEFSVRTQEHQLSLAEEVLKAADEQIWTLFEDKAYVRGNQPLEKELADICKRKQLTLAVAESLTGGSIAAKIVSISGASTFFQGSVTAYTIPVKVKTLGVDPQLIEEHGVVSEAVANAMASGVRNLLQTDIGLSSTGFAEADGDRTAQAWLGYADDRESAATWVRLLQDRKVNIERAANHALRWGLKKVQERFE